MAIQFTEEYEHEVFRLQDEYSAVDIAWFKQILWCRRCGTGFGSVYTRGTFYRTMTCFNHGWIRVR